ncbi:MAG: hypothetical protein JW755_00835 [Candidatus Aminicenantes bacterium]|nr:hypothetical protein [Candidatus Aminicenantes bacterium]
MNKYSSGKKVGRNKKRMICVKNEREFFSLIDDLLESQGFKLVEINHPKDKIQKPELMFP